MERKKIQDLIKNISSSSTNEIPEIPEIPEIQTLFKTLIKKESFHIQSNQNSGTYAMFIMRELIKNLKIEDVTQNFLLSFVDDCDTSENKNDVWKIKKIVEKFDEYMAKFLNNTQNQNTQLISQSDEIKNNNNLGFFGVENICNCLKKSNELAALIIFVTRFFAKKLGPIINGRVNLNLCNSRIEKMKKMRKHVREIVYFTRVFDLFFCRFFSSQNFTKFMYRRINPILDYRIQNNNNCTEVNKVAIYKKQIKMNFQSFYNDCKNQPNFLLNLQEILYKKCTCDIDFYMYTYDNRTNLTFKNICESVDPKYKHYLSECISPDIHEMLKGIHASPFKKLIEHSLKKLSNYNITNQIESVFLFYLCKSWIENVLGFKNWSLEYCIEDCQVVHETKKLHRMYTETRYPILLRYLPCVWVCFYEKVMYVGNIIEVMYKYKQILKENFNSKIKEFDDASESYRHYNFSLFF